MATYYLTDWADDYEPAIYICDGCRKGWCYQRTHKFCPSCGEKLDNERPSRLSCMPRGWWKKYGTRWTEIHSAPKFDYAEYEKIPDWENSNRYTQPEWKVEWTITEHMDTCDQPWGSQWRDQYIDFSNDTTEELSPKTLRERASKAFREAIREDAPFSSLTYRITYGTQTKLISRLTKPNNPPLTLLVKHEK